MNEFWYKERRVRTIASAERILKIVSEVVPFKSVVDIGCGTGTWLAVSKTLGATRVLGVDGPHVPIDTLELQPEEFRARELNTFAEDIGAFDLALSLEVAEHLLPSRAESLVSLLCRSSDSVLFSAAVPGQGGSGHINERPQSYWAELFAINGFYAYDFIRPLIWCDDDVMRWYRQNVILYSRLDLGEKLQKVGYFLNDPAMLDLIHPMYSNP